MLKVYGSMMCPDCVQIREDFDKAGVAYEYKDFAESLLNLKEFLGIRDTEAVFADVKANGKIGIPCIIREDGTITLDWESYVSQADA